MRNWTEHGFSRLTAISDAGSTPAASTSLRETKAVAPNSQIGTFPTPDEQLVIFARHLWTVLFLIERTPT